MSNQLGLALDLLSDRHIAEAARAKRAYYTFRRGVAVAATAAALFVLLFGIPFLQGESFMTAPGVITVRAYSDDPAVPYIELQEGYFHGGTRYNPLSNIIRGIPFSLGAEGVTGFTVSVDNGLIGVRRGPGMAESFSAREVLVHNISYLTWIYSGYDADTQSGWSFGECYIRVIARNGSHIVGYSVIHMSLGLDDSGYFAAFPMLLKSVSFPKISGVYQNISEDYVTFQMDAIIQADSK